MPRQAPVQHVVVPGTFDPITFGHMDVMHRATRMFPKVSVAVAASRGKRGVGTSFSLPERKELIEQAIAEDPRFADANIEVLSFDGLLVDLCHEIGAQGIVKGLRAMTDFEYELQQADLNDHMASDIESIFVMSAPEYGYVSSSIVRELASFGSDVSFLVPRAVEDALKEHFLDVYSK